MNDYIFKRSPEQYTKLADPVIEYIEQSTVYMCSINKKSEEFNRAAIKKALVKKGILNPIVKYYYTADNGDKEIREDKLTDYIKTAKENNEIMAPSFTTYIHTDEKKSIHANFLDVNIAKRKSDKKNAFKFKQLGDDDKFLYYNTLQKTRKIFNNSLSGAYASKSTILYNSSAHYTLTSITRSVTSIGNAVTESLVAGNKHFKDPEVTINYVLSVISKINMKDVRVLIDKYGLHMPSPEQVMEMILYSSRIYWKDLVKEAKIKKLLDGFSKEELVAVMYVNDLWHMKKYNDSVLRTLFAGLCDKSPRQVADPLKVINEAPEGIMNMIHHTLSVEYKGMNVVYSELSPELLNITASTTLTAIETLVLFQDLIGTFLVTDIMPPSIAHLKDMLRDSIVLSDTDSTCGSYDKWVEWYFGDIIYGHEATALSAAVMTINTQVIDHYLKIMSNNMNVGKGEIEELKMKNEYYWDIFTSTNVSKHYFANVKIQEGNVFDKPDLELKGVHLIASKANKVVRDAAYQMIDDIHTTIAGGGKLSLAKLGTNAADMERWVISEIKRGSVDIFNMDKIKEESAYKLDRIKSPYFHHMLWEEVFRDKYGTPGDPTYMVITVPTKLKSARKTREFLETIKDPIIKERLTNFLSMYGKDSVGTFRIPLMIAAERGLPEEIFEAVDVHRVVTTTVNIFYLILSSVGLYRKDELLLSEMGY